MASEPRLRYQLAEVVFCPAQRTLAHGTRTTTLDEKESFLLASLCDKRQASHEELFAHAWHGETHVNAKQLLYNKITDLRKTLATVGLADWVTTARGTGYQLNGTPKLVNDTAPPPKLSLYTTVPYAGLAQRCKARSLGGSIEPTGRRITEDPHPVDLLDQDPTDLWGTLQQATLDFVLPAHGGGTTAGRLIARAIDGCRTANNNDLTTLPTDARQRSPLQRLHCIFAPRGNTDPTYVLNAQNPKLAEVFTCNTDGLATLTHEYNNAASFSDRLLADLPNERDRIIQFAEGIAHRSSVLDEIEEVLQLQEWGDALAPIINWVIPRPRLLFAGNQ